MKQTIKFILALLVMLTTGNVGVWAQDPDLGMVVGQELSTNTALGSAKVKSIVDEISGWCFGWKVVVTVTPTAGYTRLSLMSAQAESGTDITPFYSDDNYKTIDPADATGSYASNRDVTIYIEGGSANNTQLYVNFVPGLPLKSNLTNATVEFYKSDTEPTSNFISNPGDQVAGASPGDWVVMHVTPNDGYWTNKDILFAMDKGSAPAPRRTIASELGIPVTQLGDLELANGKGWYYYQIPASHTLAAHYVLSSLDGFVAPKFNLATAVTNPNVLSSLVTSTDPVTITVSNGDWNTVITVKKTSLVYNGQNQKPELAGTKLVVKKGNIVAATYDDITGLLDLEMPTLELQPTVAKNVGKYTVNVVPKNFIFTNTALGLPFEITKKPLDVVATAENKTYDGTMTATVNGTVDTGIAGEALTISGLTGAFADANVGTGKTVTVNSSAATVAAGNAATIVGNYTVSYPGTTTANITARIVKDNPGTGENQVTVVLTGVPDGGFTYDGTNKTPTVTVKDGDNVIPSGEYTIKYKKGNDDVTNPQDAGTYTVVITDNAAGNYTVSGEKTFTIKPKALNAAATAENKTYDGTTTATVNGTVATGIAGQALTISGLTGAFADANVGTGKTVTVNSTAAVVAAGNNATKASNYTVSYPTSTTANITAKGVNGNPNSDAGESQVTIVLDPTSVTYNGADQKPAVTVKDGNTVIPSSEYTVTYKKGDAVVTEITEAGTYTIVVTDNAGGNYNVSGTATFEVNAKGVNGNPDMAAGESQVTIVLDPASVTYNGADQKPAVTVKDGNTIIPSSEYTVTYKKGDAVVTEITEAGTYTIVVTDNAGGNYNVSGTATFEVNAKGVNGNPDMAAGESQVTIVLDPASVTYNGADQKPAVTVKDGNTVIPSSEYTVTYKKGDAVVTEITEAGTYTIVVTDNAGGNYTVSGTATFEVNAKGVNGNPDMAAGESQVTIVLDPASVTYNGADQKPAVTVKDGNTVIPSSEYTVTYKKGDAVVTEITEAGTYTIVVTDNAGGNYNVSGTATFEVNAKGVNGNPDMAAGESQVTIVLDPASVTYNGADQKPAVTVKDGNTVIPSSEYTVTYKKGDAVVTEITEAGTYTIVVTDNAGGNYNVSGTATFEVSAKGVNGNPDMAAGESQVTIVLDPTSVTYNGADQKPAVTVKDGNTVIPSSEYTVTYKKGDAVVTEITEAGTYTIVVTDNAGGNYNVSGTATFEVNAKGVNGNPDMAAGESQVTIVLDPASVTYNGADQKPAVTVKDGDTVIPEGEYTVKYKKDGVYVTDTKDAGEYTIEIVDVAGGNYTVSGTTTFTINKAALTNVTLNETTLTYDGSLQTVTVQSVKAGVLDVPATAYTVSGDKQTDVGDYKLRVTAKDNSNFSGYVEADWSIIVQDASTFAVSGVADSYEYTGSDITPEPVVKEGTTTLTKNVDYTVEYSANKYVGTATITVKGKGGYSGTKVAHFTITPKMLTITANAQSKALGQDDPELAYQQEGLVEGDAITGVLSRVAGESVGTYAIQQNTLTAGINYNITFVGADFVIYRTLDDLFAEDNEWATFVAEENLNIPAGLEAYVVSGVTGTTLNAEVVSYVPKGVGLLLKRTDKTVNSYVGYAYDGAATAPESILMGNATTATAVNSYQDYVLYGDQFVLAGVSSVNKGRAYLPKSAIGSAAGASSLTINIGGFTEVREVKEVNDVNDDSWYTLGGRKLDQKPTTKGLYIYRGRKTVVR